MTADILYFNTLACLGVILLKSQQFAYCVFLVLTKISLEMLTEIKRHSEVLACQSILCSCYELKRGISDALINRILSDKTE